MAIPPDTIAMTIDLYFPKRSLLLRAALSFAVVGPFIPSALALFHPLFVMGAWMIGGLPAALAGVLFALGANLLQLITPVQAIYRKHPRVLAAALGAFSGLLAVIPFCLMSGETRSAFSFFWTSWLMLGISVPSGAICGALFCTQLWPTGEPNHVTPAIGGAHAQ